MATIAEIRLLFTTVNLASREIAALERQIIRLNTVTSANATATQQSAASAALMRSGLIAVGAASVALGAVTLKLGYDYNALRESATQAFGGLLHDVPLATRFVEQLYTWTRKTSLGFEQAVVAAQEFLARGFQLKDIIPNLQIIGDAAAALPRPIEESMQRISYAIGQITQSAKLNSQDIRQLTEAGINAWGYLTQATGASIDQIQQDALKFGLTGKKAADIILQGIKEDYNGLLQVQAQTARGQAAQARRNVQELAGIFTGRLFDDFKSALVEVNKLLTDPATLAAAKTFGDTLALAFETPIKSGKELIDILKDIKNFDVKVNLPYPNQASGSKNFSLGFNVGDVANLVGEAALRSVPGTSALLQSIKALKRDSEQASKSTGDLTSEIKFYDQRVDEVNASSREATQTLATLRDELEGLGSTSRDLVSAQLAQLEQRYNTAAQRSGINESLRELSRASDSAAESLRQQTQVVDDQISALNREIAARDRAEARTEMLESAQKQYADLQNDLISVYAQQRRLGATDVEQLANLKQQEIKIRQQMVTQQSEAAKDLKKFDRSTREQQQIQALEDQRDALQRSGDELQRARDLERKGLEDSLAFLDREAENREAVITKLQDEFEIAKKIAQLADPNLKSQEELIGQTGTIKDKFGELATQLDNFAKSLDAMSKAKDALPLVTIQDIAKNFLNSGVEGSRAFGGNVYAGRPYRVHDDFFVPKQNGTMVPASNVIGGNRVTNLAPITVNVYGTPNADNSIDILLQRMR